MDSLSAGPAFAATRRAPLAAARPAPPIRRPVFTSLPPLALYVHLPWCIRKCPYCDFNSYEATKGGFDEAAYVDALLRDLETEVAARARPRARERVHRRRDAELVLGLRDRSAACGSARAVGCRSAGRGDARGEPWCGRGRAFRRVSRRGREPIVDRRAELSRRAASAARTRAWARRSARTRST